MRYAVARFQREQRDTVYRIYVSDCLRMITENTAKACRGNYMESRWIDAVNPKPVDHRSGMEIAVDIFNRCGIEVI